MGDLPNPVGCSVTSKVQLSDPSADRWARVPSGEGGFPFVRTVIFPFSKYKETFAAMVDDRADVRKVLLGLVSLLEMGRDFSGYLVRPHGGGICYASLSENMPGELIIDVEGIRVRLRARGGPESPWRLLELVACWDFASCEAEDDPPPGSRLDGGRVPGGSQCCPEEFEQRAAYGGYNWDNRRTGRIAARVSNQILLLFAKIADSLQSVSSVYRYCLAEIRPSGLARWRGNYSDVVLRGVTPAVTVGVLSVFFVLFILFRWYQESSFELSSPPSSSADLNGREAFAQETGLRIVKLAPDDLVVRVRSLETDCLAAAVYYAAGSANDRMKRKVADVVLQRVGRAAHAKTVCGVVFERAILPENCAPNGCGDGAPKRYDAVWARASAIARRAMDSAPYLNAKPTEPSRYEPVALKVGIQSNLIKVAKVGNHALFRLGNGPAYADSIVSLPLGKPGDNMGLVFVSKATFDPTANLPIGVMSDAPAAALQGPSGG